MWPFSDLHFSIAFFCVISFPLIVEDSPEQAQFDHTRCPSYFNVHSSVACLLTGCLKDSNYSADHQPACFLQGGCRESCAGQSHMIRERHEMSVTRRIRNQSMASCQKGVSGVILLMEYDDNSGSTMQVGIFDALHSWPRFKPVPRGSWRSSVLQAIGHGFHKKECETV